MDLFALGNYTLPLQTTIPLLMCTQTIKFDTLCPPTTTIYQFAPDCQDLIIEMVSCGLLFVKFLWLGINMGCKLKTFSSYCQQFVKITSLGTLQWCGSLKMQNVICPFIFLEWFNMKMSARIDFRFSNPLFLSRGSDKEKFQVKTLLHHYFNACLYKYLS